MRRNNPFLPLCAESRHLLGSLSVGGQVSSFRSGWSRLFAVLGGKKIALRGGGGG